MKSFFFKMFYCQTKTGKSFSLMFLVNFTHNDAFIFSSIVLICYVIILIFESKSFYGISFFIIFVLATLFFFFPLGSFFIAMVISLLILFFTVSFEPYTGFFLRRSQLTLTFLSFLDQLGILDYFCVFYVRFFAQPSRYFYFGVIMLAFTNIVYLITSRWFVYHTIILQESLAFYTYIYIYLILFAGIAITYFRLLINLSSFLVNLSLKIDENLISPSIVYILNSNDNPPPAIPSEAPANRPFSFINVNRSRAYYRQYYHQDHPRFYRSSVFYVGFATMVATGFAAYYTKSQADFARIQSEQAVKQTYHTAREADVAAVEAGLISKDEYYRRHPGDKK
jgi:hypothetical protein